MRKNVESINVQEEDNRASVLQLNDLDDFLIQAEMANREFSSEKERFVILDPTTQAQEHEEDIKTISWDDQPKVTNNFAFQELSVPRRPAWDETTTAEELDQREKDSFLEWRRAIAQKEEEITLNAAGGSPLGVTPFEKNIEIWRQLWRVMERCSCIVQIVDARNPLFYLSKDLRAYATGELGKPMILLINKSDYLSPKQRQVWHEYLSHPDHQWEHVFFSAVEQQKRLDEEAAESAAAEEREGIPTVAEDDVEDDAEDADLIEEKADSTREVPIAVEETKSDNIGIETPLSREELLNWLLGYAKKYNCGMDTKYNRIPFGMVGFPNVGKSSVINVLMGNTRNAHGVVRVAVAAQPGKTKHFQTLLLPDHDNMLLCDCPGLVFPSFVNNTADLIAAGVYPIAQMRDPWPVMNLLCRRIPREILNAQYGIQIPMPNADAMLESEDGFIPPPTAEEFLTTYCIARSMFAAASGNPDFQLASRVIIKEYAAGNLLYCHSPPTFNDNIFQEETVLTAIQRTQKLREKFEKNKTSSQAVVSSEDSDNDHAAAFDEEEMLLEMMMGEIGTTQNKKNDKAIRSKSWGKKGRKLRNKDPYGCHSTPDESLGNIGASPMGVSVKAGKYGKKGYTRATNYYGARSAVS
jgi:large subunit GTPase 1